MTSAGSWYKLLSQGGRGRTAADSISWTAEQAVLEIECEPPKRSERSRHAWPGARRAATGCAIAAAALLLASVALFNGYPLVWYDTGSHVQDALVGRAHWARSIFYSAFIAAVHWQVSLWLVVVAQSLIAAHLLYLVARVTLGELRPVAAVALALAMTVASSLPWLAGQVMPDFFTGVVVLGMFLLGLTRDRLSRGEVIYLGALCAVAIASHNSHVPIALGLVVVLAGLATLLEPAHVWRWGVAKVLPCVAALAVAGAALVAWHVVDSGRVALSPYWQTFLLARFLADGPAKQYLEDACPERDFALCPHLDEIPDRSWEFLWDRNSPLYRVGGVDALRDEAREIVLGSLAAKPLWHLELAVRNTADQLASYGYPNDLEYYLESSPDGGHVEVSISRWFPSEQARFRAARQQTRTLATKVMQARSRDVTKALAVAAVLLTLVLLVARRRQRSEERELLLALAVTIGAGVVLNALATGPISQPIPRFGARVTWPLALFVFLALLSFLPTRVGSRASPRASG